MSALALVLLLSTGTAAQTPFPGPIPKPPVTLLVKNVSGAPVAGAEVFEGGVLRGTTDASGFFTYAATSGTVFVRSLVFTQPSYRPNTAGGFVMHVYQTNRVVNADGSVTDASPSAGRTFNITVRPENVLIGWHLTTTLDWDASAGELANLRARFIEASNYLYDLTDGQFFIEQVEIADDNMLSAPAEIHFKVDSFVWPHATYPGGFLYAVGGLPHIYMAPFGNFARTTAPDVLVHELGHLALGLADEYAGLNVGAGNGCTAVSLTPGPRAACFMSDSKNARKVCSGHPTLNPHRSGNWQPGPCWHTIAAAYGDQRPGTPAWTIRIPDNTGVVAGALPRLMSGLEPRTTIINNTPSPGLCAPVTVTHPNNPPRPPTVPPASPPPPSPFFNATVWVQPASGKPSFTLGRIDENGNIDLRGVHAGDVVKSPFAFLPVPCTVVP